MAWALSAEAEEQLAQWPKRARELLDELFEDAGTDLQREFLQRAVAAGHSASEVHAFADELRSMTDEEAYEACTLHEDAPEDYTVAQLLRAEADPLYAFELQGGNIEPNEASHPDLQPVRGGPSPTLELEVSQHDYVASAVARKKPSDSFIADSPAARVKPALDWNVLPGQKPSEPKKDAGPSVRFLESLLGEATRALQLSWREQDLDVPGGITLADAIASAAGALSRGIPVPCAIGPREGDHRRFIVLLQLIVSGRNRAWQLYDPFTAELVWAHEGDLLGKSELPFANKANRRLTRIVLPQSLRSSF